MIIIVFNVTMTGFKTTKKATSEPGDFICYVVW